MRHAVGVRLTRLDDDANALLAAAAVLGRGARPARAGRNAPPRSKLPRPKPPWTRSCARGCCPRPSRVRARARARGSLRRAQRAPPEPTARARGRRAERARVRAATSRRSPCTASSRPRPPMCPETVELLHPCRESSGRTPLADQAAAEQFSRALETLELNGAEAEAGPGLLCPRHALLRAGEPASAREQFTAAARLARPQQRRRPARRSRARLRRSSLSRSSTSTRRRSRGSRKRLPRWAPARCPCAHDYWPASPSELSPRCHRIAAPRRSAPPPSPPQKAIRARWRRRSTRATSRFGPHRIAERLVTAAAMIEAARVADEPHVELQARNPRVLDLLSSSATCRPAARKSPDTPVSRMNCAWLSFQWVRAAVFFYLSRTAASPTQRASPPTPAPPASAPVTATPSSSPGCSRS